MKIQGWEIPMCVESEGSLAWAEKVEFELAD